MSLSVAELRSRELPRCKADNIAKAGDAIGRLMMAAMDEYLVRFLRPSKTCPCCDSLLGGILGTFAWGLAHGTGSCGICRWPVRVYHLIQFGSEEPIRLTLMLAYHPDEVKADGE